MFEPENEVERALLQAFDDDRARPGFFRRLMDAEVFVVFIPEQSQVVDGQVVSPEGAPMMLANFPQDGETYIPFFTAASRASAYFGEAFPTHTVAPEKTRDLFERYGTVNFQLNPGTEQTKVFTPDDVARFLAGQFSDGVVTKVGPRENGILLAHPKEPPEELIAALAREFGPIDSVPGAWLMLAHVPGEAEQHPMLGLDVTDYGDDVHAALQRALSDGVLDRPLRSFLVEPSDPLSATIRSGIPIVHEKRGFFNFFRS